MGGEGAMMQANQSLKSNRKLLAKRKEKGFSFVHTSTEKTEYNLPETTPEALKRIREKLQQENRKRHVKRIIAIVVIAILIISVLIYIN